MMIVMKEEATQDQIDSVVKRVESVGAHAHVSEGEVLTVIGAIGDRERIANLDLEGTDGVDRVVPITKPYKLASSQFKHGVPTVVEVDGRKIGGGQLLPDGRPVHGREPRAAARHGRGGEAGGRLDAARRRLQAPDLAVQLPGPRRRGAAPAARRPRR